MKFYKFENYYFNNNFNFNTSVYLGSWKKIKSYLLK